MGDVSDPHELSESGSEHEIERRVLAADILSAKSSLLDLFAPDSWLKKTNFEGIFNLLVIIFTFALILTPLLAYLETGRIFDDSFTNKIALNVPKMLAAATCFFLYSFTAFVVQKVMAKQVEANTWAIKILVFISLTLEGLLFIISWLVIRKVANDNLTLSLFISISCQVTFYKMHSYFCTNLHLQSRYLESIRQGQEACREVSATRQATRKGSGVCYPANVTVKDFALFMLTPSVVYEPKFPRTSSFRPLYFLGHLSMILANLFL